MPETIEIKIPAKPKFLRVVRLEIRFICETMNFSSADVNIITLAVDEACSNIIKHAYGGPTDQPIHIFCHIHNDRVEFTIRDFGKKSDIEKIKSRQLDDVRPGGLGVHLIKTVMDEVSYDNNFDVGNQLKLIKYLTQRDPNVKHSDKCY